MFKIIGFLFGGFLGYLGSGFLGAGLDPMRESAKGAIGKGLDAGGSILSNLTKSFGQGPLINIGVLIVIALLLLWMIGFSTALVLGVIAGLIYSEEVGKLPFVSGIATTIKEKLSNRNSTDIK